MTRILIVPGLGGSGPEHWQSYWERLDSRCQRVEQASWDAPQLAAWCQRLADAVNADERPAVLVAHSLGCALVAHWAQRHDPRRVIGALLVAPADVDSEAHTPPEVRGFAPMPRQRLPFRCCVVASSDDPYVGRDRAALFAASWGARFVDLGAFGHINADSKLGTWYEGRVLLAELLARAPFSLDPRIAADGVLLAESASSLLLLMNEQRYPWLILVPRRASITELYELPEHERAQLLAESCEVARTLGDEFRADKVNLGALGNVVRQLHLHHVARFVGDPAWPGPVWGHSPRQPYADAALERMRARLRQTRLAECFRFL